MKWQKQTNVNRPWTRWWWLGSAVDKATLTKLMEEYRRIGLGGVEVTAIYGVRGQEKNNIRYLSEKWLEMIRHTISEAERLDMQVDLPLGSGWRTGGAFLPKELGAARLQVQTVDLAGGKRLRRKGLLAALAVDACGKRVNLMKRLKNGTLDWTAPDGKWKVFVAASKLTGEKVKRPGPGGEGRTFNPFSHQSLQAVLEHFAPAFDSLKVRAQFHDSWEYGSDCCAAFAGEFRQRRGYDFSDYLDVYARGRGETFQRLRHDLRLTLSEMALENFILPWTRRCHAIGQLSRNQAHGSPGNILDLYAACDIPETEVFRQPHRQTPLLSKFASSAGHVAGRRLVSSETCTWLGEHFTTSLGDAKQEIDGLFVAGINHIIYHGTAYSPETAAWPGWLFYASTQFNPQNPMWHDFDALNGYVARCQSVLQANEPDADILLYMPFSDMYTVRSGALAGKFHIEGDWFNGHAVHKAARSLWDKGFAFDYVSDKQLLEAVWRGNRLVTSGSSYKIIVVPPCRYMPWATLEQLHALAGAGATVVFVDHLPMDVPGLAELEEQRKRRNILSNGLTWNGKECRTSTIGKGRWIVGSRDNALSAVHAVRETMADHGLLFIRRKRKDGVDYFILNHTDKAFDGWVKLARPMDGVALFDPMSGRIGLAATRDDAVYLQLEPGATMIVRGWTNTLKSAPWPYVSAGKAFALTGEWRVECVAGGPKPFASFTTKTPVPWTGRGDAYADRFAGTARYSLTFDSPKSKSCLLDLGKIHASARVRLNGNEIATLLGPTFTVRLDNLKPSENRLEIDVTSLAANRIRDLDRRDVKWKIFADINFVNMRYKKFDASSWPVRPCGLEGPVTIAELRPLQPQ